MASDLDIVSMGMGWLRANSVQDFDEGTNEADIATLYWANFAKDILTRYPWSFATKKRLLNQDATAPVNEYRYSHIVPAECMRIWALFPDNSVGAKPITDYDVQGPEGQRRIFSNYETLYGEYTADTDATNWPAYFVTFAFKAFAALVAKPVTDQTALIGALMAVAWGSPSENEQGGAFGVACKIDAMQKPGETINSSPLIAARFS